MHLRQPLHTPLLVFGGPYSNLRVHCICTGDVVAYCAEPEATVAAIQDSGCHVIAGNCEEQLAAGAVDCGCGFADDSACNRLA